jgi:D-alanyl-D-alanine carboxypeptidase/D-alanyl-D-alanine-endopeptidase (penicillin-binding protein 4)
VKPGSRLVLPVALSALPLLALGASPNKLLFHAETADGTVVASRGADTVFNPASVVKIATSGWSLDHLGPEFRFVTAVGYRGRLNSEVGIIEGTLVLRGSGDPDFQLENVFLITLELNKKGLFRVTDGIELEGPMTLGWEHGVEGRLNSERRRRRQIADRFRNVFDHSRWDQTAKNTWIAMCARRGLSTNSLPKLELGGPIRWSNPSEFNHLMHHKSNPLPVLLRRFNVYSNNDIIRIAEHLGGVEALEGWLRRRIGSSSPIVALETASGEGRNRLTARGVVRLLREFDLVASNAGLEPENLLAVPGCDPGPIRRMFPLLASGTHERRTVVKTGTLRQTDGGVAVLAGYYQTADGTEILYCVAAPRAGSQIQSWRRLEQQWITDLMTRTGVGAARPCGEALPFSDSDVIIELISPAPTNKH